MGRYVCMYMYNDNTQDRFSVHRVVPKKTYIEYISYSNMINIISF